MHGKHSKFSRGKKEIWATNNGSFIQKTKQGGDLGSHKKIIVVFNYKGFVQCKLGPESFF
mgnify:FL=1